jgi:hypothetical protein
MTAGGAPTGLGLVVHALAVRRGWITLLAERGADFPLPRLRGVVAADARAWSGAGCTIRASFAAPDCRRFSDGARPLTSRRLFLAGMVPVRNGVPVNDGISGGSLADRQRVPEGSPAEVWKTQRFNGRHGHWAPDRLSDRGPGMFRPFYISAPFISPTSPPSPRHNVR